MITGYKILGKHIRPFLHKNNVKTSKFDVLVLQNSVVVVCKITANKDKKRAARENLFVFAN